MLERNWDTKKLINELRPLVEGHEFSIYTYINNGSNISDTYIKFKSLLFGKQVSYEEIEDKINMLKYSITVLYKECELRRSKKEVITEEEYNIIKETIKNRFI